MGLFRARGLRVRRWGGCSLANKKAGPASGSALCVPVRVPRRGCVHRGTVCALTIGGRSAGVPSCICGGHRRSRQGHPLCRRTSCVRSSEDISPAASWARRSSPGRLSGGGGDGRARLDRHRKLVGCREFDGLAVGVKEVKTTTRGTHTLCGCSEPSHSRPSRPALLPHAGRRLRLLRAARWAASTC